MAARTAAPTAIAELGEHDQAVKAAANRVQELEAEKQKASRALDRAKGPLRDYYEQLGAGERKPDPELERRLIADVSAAAGVVTTRPVLAQGNLVGLEVVDERVESALAGARRALEEREIERRSFIAEHFKALAAELAVEGREVRDRFQAAYEELLAIENDYMRIVRRWHPLLEAARPTSPKELPPSPLRGLDDAIDRGIPLPMPAWLVPDEERVS